MEFQKLSKRMKPWTQPFGTTECPWHWGSSVGSRLLQPELWCDGGTRWFGTDGRAAHLSSTSPGHWQSMVFFYFFLGYTLVIQHDNGQFTICGWFPIDTSTYTGFPIATFDFERVPRICREAFHVTVPRARSDNPPSKFHVRQRFHAAIWWMGIKHGILNPELYSNI